MSNPNDPTDHNSDPKDFGWGMGNPMPGKKPEEMQTEPKPQITKISLFRDIFEASSLQYPSHINCSHCKGEDKADLVSTPYGYLAQMPGYLAYHCNRCGAMIYIEANTLFFCHPGTFITSLDILKQRFARFASPLAGNWVDKKFQKELDEQGDKDAQ